MKRFIITVLLAVLAAGCSRSRMTAAEEADVLKSFGLAPGTPMTDLGLVELRSGIAKRVRLGPGKDCTITAILLTNGLVKMDLLYEFKGDISDGVKTQSHTERSQIMFPQSATGWICLPRIGQEPVVAMQPMIFP